MTEEFPEDEVNNAARNVVGGSEKTDLAPWWEKDVIIKEWITTPLRETFTLTSFDKATDILNYSDEDLSEEEIRQLAEAISAIATFTGGKVFERIKGIALAPRESFPRDDYGKELGPEDELAGYVNKYSPVVMMNIDAIRHPLVPQGKTAKSFVETHFPGYKPTRFQFFLTHEIGHLIDLTYLSEIERHGMDPDLANRNWMGFKTVDQQDVVTKNFHAFEHPDPTVHLMEPSITERSLQDAGEDFAEVFAIAALGGNISEVPRKYQRLVETIHLANGQAVVGPHQVEIRKVS